jgi:hypothetical protein
VTAVNCNLDALDEDERARRAALQADLRPRVLEIRSVPSGYALRIAPGEASRVEIEVYISLERRCCPFLRFAIEEDEDGDWLWLRVTGLEGVKEYLAGELGVTR